MIDLYNFKFHRPLRVEYAVDNDGWVTWWKKVYGIKIGKWFIGAIKSDDHKTT